MLIYLKRLFIISILLCLGTALSNAQRLEVFDSFGHPLSGATVETENGTYVGATGDSGVLDIPAAYVGDMLIVRASDYYLQKIRIKDKTPTVLRLDKAYLQSPEEVGLLYEIKRRRDIVGAVSSVFTPQLTTTPTPLYLNALTGRLPGFYTQMTNGFRNAVTQPITYNDLAGSLPTLDPARSFPGGAVTLSAGNDNTIMYFMLRGQPPVTIVDGVQRNIYSIDPENIASISVLKDGLSTLLLGMKSSRGVLKITTKRGTLGPPEVSLTAQTGWQSPLKTPDPISAYQYAYLYNEALLNEGQAPIYSLTDFKRFRDDSSMFLYPDVNWYDKILKDRAPISKYNLSVSGGVKNARYFLSLSYFNQQGLFVTDKNEDYNTNLNFNRYLINSHIDVDVTDDFTVGLQIFGRVQDGNQPGAGTGTILGQLHSTPNNAYPVFNPDGSYGGASQYSRNLYQLTTGSGYLLDNRKDLLANVDLKYTFNNWLPGLYAKGMVNVSSSSSNIVDRSKSAPVYDLTVDANGKLVYSRFGNISDQSNTFNTTSLAQQFYAQLAVGYEGEKRGHQFGGKLFVDQQKSTYQFLLPEKYTNLAFAAHYNYAHKYFAEAAVDYAGYDRYAPGDRFGFVYAAGLGWDIARESFIKDQATWIQQLKVRAAYGQTANSNEGALGYFPWRRAFGQDGNNGYPAGTGYSTVNGIAEMGLANVNATWEKAHKLDIGIDGVFFNNHLSVKLDYYHDVYYDLLQQRGSTIQLMGLPYPNENIGKNLYEGQEVSISYQDHIGNFNFFIAANVSRMRTEVLYMDELNREYPWNVRTGRPVGQTFGYLADGLIQTQAEADTTATFAGVTVYPGDVKLVDLNNDGVIDQFDQTAIGNTKPIVYYGVTLGFNFKGFDFSILLQGVQNRTYQQRNYSFGSEGKGQAFQYIVGRWIPENAATATHPRLTTAASPNNMPFLNSSSYWTRSGEYFRIRNASLGYTIPYSLTERIKISQIRLFVQAQNIFTYTPYSRLDPEIHNDSSYPMQKIISMGVNVKF